MPKAWKLKKVAATTFYKLSQYLLVDKSIKTVKQSKFEKKETLTKGKSQSTFI